MQVKTASGCNIIERYRNLAFTPPSRVKRLRFSGGGNASGPPNCGRRWPRPGTGPRGGARRAGGCAPSSPSTATHPLHCSRFGSQKRLVDTGPIQGSGYISGGPAEKGQLLPNQIHIRRKTTPAQGLSQDQSYTPGFCLNTTAELSPGGA